MKHLRQQLDKDGNILACADKVVMLVGGDAGMTLAAKAAKLQATFNMPIVNFEKQTAERKNVLDDFNITLKSLLGD